MPRERFVPRPDREALTLLVVRFETDHIIHPDVQHNVMNRKTASSWIEQNLEYED
jgi:hypothetical protein